MRSISLAFMSRACCFHCSRPASVGRSTRSCLAEDFAGEPSLAKLHGTVRPRTRREIVGSASVCLGLTSAFEGEKDVVSTRVRCRLMTQRGHAEEGHVHTSIAKTCIRRLTLRDGNGPTDEGAPLSLSSTIRLSPDPKFGMRVLGNVSPSRAFQRRPGY